MRTEAEIREAIKLCQSCNPTDNFGIQNRDATIEALRFALGIDDADTSPMETTLQELLQDMCDDPAAHGIRPEDSFSE